MGESDGGRWRLATAQAPTPLGRGLVHAAFALADDAWETRAGKLPHLEVIGEVGAAEAVDLVVLDEHSPGWARRLRLAPIGGEVEITQEERRRVPPTMTHLIAFSDDGEDPEAVQVADERDPEPLTTRLLRRSGFGHVVHDAKRLITDPVVRERFLGAAWARPSVRAGREQKSPYEHAMWANRYVWALARDRRRPLPFIVAADRAAGVERTIKEVSGHVSRARPEYLSRSAEPGMAGGELTDTARRLLRELCIEPGSDRVIGARP